jgi:hypothetical protein
MIEVFKTNIQNKTQTEEIERQIFKQFPSLKINFDLEDIDNVLRVEGNVFDSNEIINVLINNNFECEIMK